MSGVAPWLRTCAAINGGLGGGGGGGGDGGDGDGGGGGETGDENIAIIESLVDDLISGPLAFFARRDGDGPSRQGVTAVLTRLGLRGPDVIRTLETLKGHPRTSATRHMDTRVCAVFTRVGNGAAECVYNYHEVTLEAQEWVTVIEHAVVNIEEAASVAADGGTGMFSVSVMEVRRHRDFVGVVAGKEPTRMLTERYTGTTILGDEARLDVHFKGPKASGANVIAAILLAMVHVYGHAAARAKVNTRILGDPDDFSFVGDRANVHTDDAAYFFETVTMTVLRTVASDGLGGANMHRGDGMDPRRTVAAVLGLTCLSLRLSREGHDDAVIVSLLDRMEGDLSARLYGYACAAAFRCDLPVEKLTKKTLNPSIKNAKPSPKKKKKKKGARPAREKQTKQRINAPRNGPPHTSHARGGRAGGIRVVMSSDEEAKAAHLLAQFLSPHTTSQDRTALEASLIAVRDGPGAWRWGLELLSAPVGVADARAGGGRGDGGGGGGGGGGGSGGGGAALQWLAAAAVESAILRRWQHLMPADRNAVLTMAWGCLIPPAQGVSPMAANKLAKALVDVAKLQWPEEDPGFFDRLLAAAAAPSTSSAALRVIAVSFEELSVREGGGGKGDDDDGWKGGWEKSGTRCGVVLFSSPLPSPFLFQQTLSSSRAPKYRRHTESRPTTTTHEMK